MAREYPKGVKGWGEAQRKYDVFARLNQLRLKHETGYNADGGQEPFRKWLADWLDKNCKLTGSQKQNALPVKYCDLPQTDLDGSFAQEACMISEREVWWNLDSLSDGPMKDRRNKCRQWLERQRKQIYADGEGKQPDKSQPQPNPDNKPYGWDKKNRKQRYEYLQVATKHGSGWKDWKATHDTTTGKAKPKQSNVRDQIAKWQENHLGITEQPAGSNCDNREDGIRKQQDNCANGTWLRYQPWCGVWVFGGYLAAGIVKKGDSWMASCASIESYAKQGKGPFKGWTTDGSKAKKGDAVLLFGPGQHVGTVREITSTTCRTWEGNTSSGSGGSQSNGGGSFKRDRSRSGETYGYALLRD